MKDKVIKDAMNSIENRIRHVYNQGLEDGLNDGLHDSVIIDRDVYRQGYEKGLKDSWECVRKIYNDLSIDKCIEIFQGKSWFDYTISEVIALINKYENEQKAKCEKCVHKDDDFDCHNFCVPYNFDHFKEKQNNDNNSNTSQKENSSDNKEDDTYVYLYKGTFSQFKEGNSVLLSTDITYWDRNTHDDKVLKAGEIHTIKEYFPETGACLITVNIDKSCDEILNKDRCKKCPNDGKCRLCLTGINWDLLKDKED